MSSTCVFTLSSFFIWFWAWTSSCQFPSTICWSRKRLWQNLLSLIAISKWESVKKESTLLKSLHLFASMKSLIVLIIKTLLRFKVVVVKVTKNCFFQNKYYQIRYVLSPRSCRLPYCCRHISHCSWSESSWFSK